MRIEEKLIGLINNLLSRIRKITYLRHEIHQPNIAVFGTLTKVIDKIEDIKKLVSTQEDVVRECDSIIRSLKYSKNASRLFSTIIENICASLGGDDPALSLERHNILNAIDEAKNIFEIEALEKEVILKPIEKRNVVSTYHIECDRGLIMRAFINAFNNAVKYSYYGVTEIAQRTITTKVWNLEKYFRISIANYGVGIAKEEIDRVWEEGYRGILSSDRYRTGSGLGLYQVKKIVEAHKGKVQIESDPASENYISGPYLTTLTIDLPYSHK